MTGVFRRAIRIEAGTDWAQAEIEDDFHHFVVRLRHDGRQVTAGRGEAVRHPWSLCPAAGAALSALEGLALSPNPAAVFTHTDPLGQCTHMFETAGLALSQAFRGPGARRYDAHATDAVDGRSEVVLARDGQAVARWVLQDGVIAEPAEHAGRRPAEFRSRTLSELPPEAAEHLLILRRAAILGPARTIDVDQFPTAADMKRGHACFVFSPARAARAQRRYGSVRDFSTGPGPLAGPPPPSGEA
ncbi:MAG: DUF2889 domain-containing protein [Caulobacterales bacterium]|nr:DUF2889 domain-containing protein [Caulobacterales bacterium]